MASPWRGRTPPRGLSAWFVGSLAVVLSSTGHADVAPRHVVPVPVRYEENLSFVSAAGSEFQISCRRIQFGFAGTFGVPSQPLVTNLGGRTVTLSIQDPQLRMSYLQQLRAMVRDRQPLCWGTDSSDSAYGELERKLPNWSQIAARQSGVEFLRSVAIRPSPPELYRLQTIKLPEACTSGLNHHLVTPAVAAAGAYSPLLPICQRAREAIAIQGMQRCLQHLRAACSAGGGGAANRRGPGAWIPSTPLADDQFCTGIAEIANVAQVLTLNRLSQLIRSPQLQLQPSQWWPGCRASGAAAVIFGANGNKIELTLDQLVGTQH